MSNQLSEAIQKRLKALQTIDRYDHVERIDTGSIAFNHLLGGGFPRGRMIEVFGFESYGKSTLLGTSAAHLLRSDPQATVAYFDVEGSLTREELEKRYGADIDRFVVKRGKQTAEDTLEELIALVKEDLFDLIILDSIAALSPSEVEDKTMGDSSISLLARLLSQKFFPRIMGLDYKACLIFTNQMRYKIGVMGGDPTTTPGGQAKQHYFSVRVRLNKPEILRDRTTLVVNGKPKTIESDVIQGYIFKARATKNKTAPLLVSESEVYLRQFSHGLDFDYVAEAVDISKELMVFTNKDGEKISGNAKWLFGETELAVGRDATVSLLYENVPLREQVLTALKEKMK